MKPTNATTNKLKARSIKYISEELSLSYNYVYGLVSSGKLKAIGIQGKGGRVMWRVYEHDYRKFFGIKD